MKTRRQLSDLFFLSLVLAATFVFFTDCAAADNPEEPRVVTAVQGDWLFLHHYNDRSIYNFYVYLPSDFWEEEAETFPLILFLHGDGGDRSYVPDPYPEMLSGGPLPLYDTSTESIVDNRDGLNPLVAKSIVVYPKIAQIDPTYANLLGYWNPTVINRLFDDIVEMYRVDRKRIYVTGLSFGGGGTWYYANDNDRAEYTPAAIVPICNGLSWNLLDGVKARMPVWTFQCFDDPVVPYMSTIRTMEKVTGRYGIMSAYPYGENNSASDSDCTVSFAKETGLGAWKKNYYLADGSYTYTMFRSGGHDAWSRAYDMGALYEWLFSQTAR